MSSSLDNFSIKIVKQIEGRATETVELFVKSDGAGVVNPNNGHSIAEHSIVERTSASQRDLFTSPTRRSYAVPKTPPPTLKGKVPSTRGLTPQQLTDLSRIVADHSTKEKSGRSSRSTTPSRSLNQSGELFIASTPKSVKSAKRNSTQSTDLPSKSRKSKHSQAHSLETTKSYESAKSRRSASAPPRRSSRIQTPTEVARHSRTQTPTISGVLSSEGSKASVPGPLSNGSASSSYPSIPPADNRINVSARESKSPMETLNLSKSNGEPLSPATPAIVSPIFVVGKNGKPVPDIILGSDAAATPPGYYCHQKNVVLNATVNGLPLKTNLTLYVSTRNPQADMKIVEFWADDECLYRANPVAEAKKQ